MTEPKAANAESSFLVRALADADWPDAKALDAAAFGYEPDHDYLDTISLPAQDIRRFIGVFDPALDSRPVGIAAIQSRTINYPGGRAFPVAAVTWVGVRPDQQRRGILRQLMKAQLHDLHDSGGEPIAILTASEGGIYGRFG
jgi:predicted N-acetyltransferase YhbS